MQSSPPQTPSRNMDQQQSPRQLSALNRAFATLPEHRDTVVPLSPPASTRTTPTPSAEQTSSSRVTPVRERCNTDITQPQSSAHDPSAPQHDSRSFDLSDHVSVFSASIQQSEASRSPSASTIAARERDLARERLAELEVSRELLRPQGSPTPTQESVVPPRTHALSPTADPFPPPLANHQTFSRLSQFPPHYHHPLERDHSPVHSVSTKGSQTSSDLQTQDGKTPNVYINGLPPNFLEEQLLEMTKEFGAVISVRTFTRHVSDKPSGYGFVLFETVDAAEKCIETLRKYRNLHPSFSKQLHKIPGTPYASLSSSNLGGPPPDSFKARMEMLQDKSSTNLYMEGLPMSTDEKMLAALVTPYRIMSSRFFQTRLSSPPRIIAFVRLESRTAAEEIIERLHGHLLRGLDDAGSRISVRFADTSEQREMRRMERMNHEGDPSPSRITMAQAALLNLKGTQLQSPTAQQKVLPRHIIGASTQISPPGSSVHSPEMYGRSGLPLPLSLPRTPYQQTADLPMLMDAHLDGFADLNALGAPYLRQGLRIPQHDMYDEELAMLQEMQMQQHMNSRAMPTRAQDGYTDVERLILQAHQQQQQQARLIQAQRQIRAAQKMNPNGDSGRRLLDVLPPMSEDDFHASAGGAHLDLYHGREPSFGSSVGSPQILGSGSDGSQLAMDMDRQLALSQQQQHQRIQTHAALAAPRQTLDSTHMRSTTFPAKYPGARMGSQSLTYGGFGSGGLGNGYGGLSIDTNTSTNVSNLASLKNNQYSSNSTVMRTQNNGSSNVISNGNKISIGSEGNISSRSINNTSLNSKHHIGVNPSSSIKSSSSGLNNTLFSTSIANSSGHGSAAAHHTTTRLATSDAHTVKSPGGASPEQSDEGSPLVSPALTYSARTPATLSPSTPYSGFFGHSAETFDGPAIGVGEVHHAMPAMGENQKARAAHQHQPEGVNAGR